jgi:hypothetical protein
MSPCGYCRLPLNSTYTTNEAMEIKLFVQDDNDDEDKEVNK